MSDLYRFDVQWDGDEFGLRHYPSDDGDYCLADDALELKAKIEKLEKAVNWWEGQSSLKKALQEDKTDE